MKKYCVGIDIGGTTVKCGIFEGASIVEQWEIPTDTSDGGKNILNDIGCSVREKLYAKCIDISEVEGLGIGVPGAVKSDGTVLGCVNLGWGVFNIESETAKLFEGLTIKAGNDANVAALGELWQGGAKGYSDAVMVTIGTGVGGGIIIDGSILTGDVGGAGEIGHMPVNINEPDYCNCGKRGCLEQYASATGIVKETKRLLECSKDKYGTGGTRESALCSLEEITAKDVFDLAKTGDEAALKVVEQTGKYLGLALANIASVVNPQVFIIGGGVSKAGGILIDVIEKYYREHAFHACRNAKVVTAQLGNDAGIYGAAAMIVKK